MDEPVLPALTDEAVEERLDRLEDVLGRVEQLQGPTAELAIEAVGLLVDVYGAALSRVMAAARGAPEVSRALVADQLVSHLLVLHELHPDSLEERVTRAIEDVRPYARSHGGDIELAAIDGDVVRVRLSGSCDGCASSTATLKLAVEDRVRAVAPGVAVVEALTGASPKDPTTFIPAEALLRKPVVAGPRPGPA